MARAKEYLREGVKKGYKIQGPGYINNSRLYDTLGLILVHEGDYPRALEAFEHARRPYELQRMSDNHYFNILGNEFCVLDRLYEYDRGYQLFREEIERRIGDINRKLSPDEFIRFLSNVGCFLFNSSRYTEARAILNHTIKYPVARNSLDNDSYVKLFTNLACLEMREKEQQKADSYFKRALERETESFRVRTDLVPHWTSYHLHNNLALFYFKRGEFSKSIREFCEVQESLASIEEDEDMMDQSLIHLNYNIAWVYEKWKKPDKAIEHFEEAARVARRFHGEDHIFIETIVLDLERLNKLRIVEESAEHYSESMSVLQARPQPFVVVVKGGTTL